MNWKKQRRGNYYSTSEDGQIGYEIYINRRGRFYIKGYLAGGAEHRLPFQDFDTAEAAIAWVEQHEQERAERKARYAQEEPIRF